MASLVKALWAAVILLTIGLGLCLVFAAIVGVAGRRNGRRHASAAWLRIGPG